MRILMATLGYLPAVAWGGPVKIVRQNAAELQRRGHEVVVIASNLLDKQHRLSKGNSEALVDGISVNYLDTRNVPSWRGTLGPTWLIPSARRQLVNLVAWSDIVHVNGSRNAVVMAAMKSAIQLNKPLVLQPHGTLQYIENSVFYKRMFDKLLFGKNLAGVDGFIAAQDHERKQLTTMGAANDRIHVVANGIDAPPGGNAYQRPGILRTRYSIAADEQIVLFLGRINHKKGTDLLVKAYAQLPERIREHSYLIIAGPDDGQLDEVLTLVNAHGLQQRAIFTGLLNDEEVWSAYADTDLFVLPCRTDTFPMAIVEACAANVPMVLTDTCEIADMFREKAATVIPVEIQKIAEGIEQLLENECLRQQYRVGMAEIMRNHLSIEVIGDALEAVYSDASERHHSAV